MIKRLNKLMSGRDEVIDFQGLFFAVLLSLRLDIFLYCFPFANVL